VGAVRIAWVNAEKQSSQNPDHLDAGRFGEIAPLWEYGAFDEQPQLHHPTFP
jgi:hypothetical protein